MATDWHKLADERAQEIIRLSTLLDDAVDIIIAHRQPERGPMLDAHTAQFFSIPKIVEIREALADAGWQGPKLICPACGADYAEAEKSNELFQTPQFRALVADISRSRMCTIAEAEQLARANVVVLPRKPRFAELDVVRVKATGEVGTIVHVHPPLDPDPAYEVEFVDGSTGSTLRLATLRARELEKVP